MNNQVRFIQLDANRADQARRSVPATISTEYPVNRGDYQEVLLHGPENIDLSRAPLPLIESHDGSTLNIGTVEGLHVSGKKLRGTVRFGTSARASEVWNDVRDGIVRNVSVGYFIDDHDFDGDTLRATRWSPHEVSLVSIPADPSAGLNRSHPLPFARDNIMNDIQSSQSVADADNEHRSRSQRRGDRAAAEAERQRVRSITTIAEQYGEFIPGVTRLARTALNDGHSEDQFRAALLEASNRRESQPIADVGGAHYGSHASHGERRFSVSRALGSMIDPNGVDAGFEREVSQEIAHRSGRKPRGMYMPMGDLSERMLSVSGASDMVGEQHLAGSFIDALRARSTVMNLGPMILNGLTQDVSIPRLSSSATSYWIAGDGSDALTESTPTFDAVTLSPKTVGALVLLSRKMVLQSEPSAEEVVRNDLAQVIANALDVAAIQGTGASNQPTGIVNMSGITSDEFAAASPTFAEIVAMESALQSANVDASRAAYLTTPALAGGMKTTTVTANGDAMVWTQGNEPGVGTVNGLRAYSTTNCPDGNVIVGNWADFIMGFWGGVDIEINPYQDFAKGVVGVRCFASVDFGVRHEPSFAVYATPSP